MDNHQTTATVACTSCMRTPITTPSQRYTPKKKKKRVTYFDVADHAVFLCQLVVIWKMIENLMVIQSKPAIHLDPIQTIVLSVDLHAIPHNTPNTQQRQKTSHHSSVVPCCGNQGGPYREDAMCGIDRAPEEVPVLVFLWHPDPTVSHRACTSPHQDETMTGIMIMLVRCGLDQRWMKRRQRRRKAWNETGCDAGQCLQVRLPNTKHRSTHTYSHTQIGFTHVPPFLAVCNNTILLKLGAPFRFPAGCHDGVLPCFLPLLMSVVDTCGRYHPTGLRFTPLSPLESSTRRRQRIHNTLTALGKRVAVVVRARGGTCNSP